MFYSGDNMNQNNKMKEKYSIEILGKDYYLPYEWNQLDLLFDCINMSQITENTVGVHWFNGAVRSRKYVDCLDKIHKSNFKLNCTLDVLIKDYIMYK